MREPAPHDIMASSVNPSHTPIARAPCSTMDGLLALLGLAASPDQPALAWYRPPQPPGRLAFGLCMAALLGCANAASSSRTS